MPIDLKHLTTAQKAAIGGGVVLGAYFLYRGITAHSQAVANQSSGPSMSPAVSYDTGTGTSDVLTGVIGGLSDLAAGQQQIAQTVAANTQAISAIQSYLAAMPAPAVSPTTGQTQAPEGAGTAQTAPAQPVPKNVPGATRSGVTQPLVVDKTPSGQIVVGSNYQAVVNAAGGYWQNGQWVAGKYVNGQFTKTPQKPTPVPAVKAQPAIRTQPVKSTAAKTTVTKPIGKPVAV
ncbi:MAG: hypothetical protein K6T83_07835 [Alicyclobacillus sp.]|nr:hypothetical protein [Alicyclobacillus sp.]